MTVDIDEARELLEKSSQTNKAFMVNNSANWRNGSIKCKELIDSNKIGEIRHATILFHGPTHFVFNNPIMKSWNEPSGKMLGNGHGWGQLSHPLAWFFMVSGLTPSQVFTFNGLSKASGSDMFNACSILCTNGATVS